MATASRNPTGQSPSATPILVRFFGGAGDVQGVNGDYFTVGDTGNEDIPLPSSLKQQRPVKLRFSRGAQGWRVTAAEDQTLYVNQRRTLGLTDIVSGDVVRLAPGGPGMQFLLRQQDASLTRLASRMAPRRSAATPSSQPAKSQATPVVATRESHWTKRAGIVIAVAIAVLFTYWTGALWSAPAPSPASAEAGE